MINLQKKILSKIGKEPLCNGRKERAPNINGFCFILCWRCTSLISSIIICYIISYIITGNGYISMDFEERIIGGIMLIPTIVDGILQYKFEIESTNARRIILGIISGIGIWILTPISYDLIR